MGRRRCVAAAIVSCSGHLHLLSDDQELRFAGGLGVPRHFGAVVDQPDGGKLLGRFCFSRGSCVQSDFDFYAGFWTGGRKNSRDRTDRSCSRVYNPIQRLARRLEYILRGAAVSKTLQLLSLLPRN